ncbi:AzlD domain-containing protein [Desulfovibrio sp. OttesenSCG-928-O18]|nr:AzlD domain-containing protein [Desulfovibrio sp. OttesenSCG-928-O18]
MSDLLPQGQLLLIAGMTAVTYIPRVLPLWLLSSRSLHPSLMRWLEMIPPAVLSALLAPALLLQKDATGAEILFVGLDNTFLLAAVPSFLMAWKSKSFLGTVIVGMGSVALLRFLLG